MGTADFETAPISEVTIQVPWEKLEPGPGEEYLKVIDIDPGSGCFYSPVELNDPPLLAQNALETDADWAGWTKSQQAATHVQIADYHIDFLPE